MLVEVANNQPEHYLPAMKDSCCMVGDHCSLGILFVGAEIEKWRKIQELSEIKSVRGCKSLRIGTDVHK